MFRYPWDLALFTLRVRRDAYTRRALWTDLETSGLSYDLSQTAGVIELSLDGDYFPGGSHVFSRQLNGQNHANIFI
jgi:hypothetical protein